MQRKIWRTTPARDRERRGIFISHANPEDNTFALWLAAKLAALGYEVWADLQQLRGGNDWQRKLENALRYQTEKVLLVGTAAGVNKQGVRNEVQIANDVAKSVGDDSFIIPLKLEPFEVPFLIAQAQYVPFDSGWANGLNELLETLKAYGVKTGAPNTADWEHIQQVHAAELVHEKERLISNWLTFHQYPQQVWFHDYGPLSDGVLSVGSTVPHVFFKNGVLTFAKSPEQHLALPSPIRSSKIPVTKLLSEGWPSLGADWFVANNMFSDLATQAIERTLTQRGLRQYLLSNRRSAWWLGIDKGPTGQVAFEWNDVHGARQVQGFSPKRSVYWHLAPSFVVRMVPRPHVRFQSHLVFGENGRSAFTDPSRMHKLRRSFASGWRNPRWRDMMLAFLYWLSEGANRWVVAAGGSESFEIQLPPLQFACPVRVLGYSQADVDEEDPSLEPEEQFDENLEDEV